MAQWISIEQKKPDVGSRVLVLCDYTEFERGKTVNIAYTNYTDTDREYGGPNSVSGSGFLKGLFFSIPAVLKPGIVTHWQELPSTEIK